MYLPQGTRLKSYSSKGTGPKSTVTVQLETADATAHWHLMRDLAEIAAEQAAEAAKPKRLALPAPGAEGRT